MLDDSFLDTGRPLGVARLLVEIGPTGATVLELRRRLGLDSGYLSRLLGALDSDDLVAVAPDSDDGRRRRVILTSAGHDEWRRLDQRSNDAAGALLEPLSPRRRAELTTALDTVDRLPRAATVEFDVVDPRSDEAVAAMTAYFEELELRFPTGFDPATP